MSEHKAKDDSPVHLSFQQKFAVGKTLEDWRDLIRNSQWGYADTCRELKKKYPDYPLTDANVRGIMRELNIPPGVRQGGAHSRKQAKINRDILDQIQAAAERVKGYEDRLARAEARIAQLETDVGRLMTELGYEKLDRAVSQIVRK